jgi:hypothetical protein
MAGVAKTNSASVTRVAVLGDPDTAIGPRPVRGHSSRRAFTQGGGQRVQQARRQRNRARRHGLRANPKWWTDRDRRRPGFC